MIQKKKKLLIIQKIQIIKEKYTLLAQHVTKKQATWNIRYSTLNSWNY